MGTSLPRTSPEAQGIASAAIAAFIEAVERDIHELHSVMLVRRGAVVAEGWWSPYHADLPHMLYSLSKSFTSTAVGMAVAEGRLSVNDPVISFFPDDTPAEVGDHLAAMRVHHLLSMGTGHGEDTTVRLRGQRHDTNWVRLFLALPVEHEPGTHFVYNSGASYMLSAIVQRVTGERLLDYLRPRLFEPLGIDGATWEQSPQGIDVGGWGLKIKTEDIARFGQLYLQKGVWNGERLIAEDWIAQATSKQISNGDDPDNDWNQGYGYQFWLCRHNAYRGDGAHGQFCIVMPEQELVVAITSGVTDMQAVMNKVWDGLLPACQPEALPENPPAWDALRAKLAGLALAPPSGASIVPLTEQVTGRTYNAQAPEEPAPVRTALAYPLDVQAVTFEFESEQAVVAFTVYGDERRIVCGYGEWVENDGISPMFWLDSPALASGVWISDDTFVVTVRLYETPYYFTLRFTFEGDQVVARSAVNVGGVEPLTIRFA